MIEGGGMHPDQDGVVVQELGTGHIGHRKLVRSAELREDEGLHPVQKPGLIGWAPGGRVTGRGGWSGALLAEPAAWAVPITFAAMVLVSIATRRDIRPDVARTMVRLHTPETLDLDRGATSSRRPDRDEPLVQIDRSSPRIDRLS